MSTDVLYIFSQTIIAYASLRLNANSISVKSCGWKYDKTISINLNTNVESRIMWLMPCLVERITFLNLNVW